MRFGVTYTRHLATSQVVDLRDKLYMIDCGEGTQVQMRRMRLHFGRLAISLSRICMATTASACRADLYARHVGSYRRAGRARSEGGRDVPASHNGFVLPGYGVRSAFQSCRYLQPFVGDGGSVVVSLLHPAEAPDSYLRLSLRRKAERGAYHPRDDGFLPGPRPLPEGHQTRAGLCHARR